MSPGPARLWNGRIVALLAIVLVALSMRVAVNVMGVVFATIAGDLDLSIIVLSILAGTPPVGFAFAGILVPLLTRRLRLEASLLVAIAVIAAGQLLRAVSGGPVLLIASTALIMVGIGAANVLLPPLVRRYFPQHIGPITSLYLVTMSLSASTPALVGVQVADAWGWRIALVMWAIFPLAALVPWLHLLRGARRQSVNVPIVEFDDGSSRPPLTPTRRSVAASPTVWAMTILFAFQATSIYVSIGFLPAMAVALVGMSETEAAVLLGVTLLVGVPPMLLVPLVSDRRFVALGLVAISGVFTVIGWGGLLLAPQVAPYLWATIIGLIPVTFPLILVLVNTRTRDHRVTVSVSGFVQGVAYVTAGLSSFGAGMLQELTGSWTAPLVVLMATAILAVPAYVILSRDRLVDDEIIAQPQHR